MGGKKVFGSGLVQKRFNRIQRVFMMRNRVQSRNAAVKIEKEFSLSREPTWGNLLIRFFH
jgi:hypothetical protein